MSTGNVKGPREAFSERYLCLHGVLAAEEMKTAGDLKLFSKVNSFRC